MRASICFYFTSQEEGARARAHTHKRNPEPKEITVTYRLLVLEQNTHAKKEDTTKADGTRTNGRSVSQQPAFPQLHTTTTYKQE